MTSALFEQGFSIIPSVFEFCEIKPLLEAFSAISDSEGVWRRGSIYAIRNLLDSVPEVAALASSSKVRSLVEPVLGRRPFAVRGILFDKTADANWLVPLRQDLTISVKRKIEAAGYGPWSSKAGVDHVQPPVAVLESMPSLRLHLDDCDDTNGPLRILPGTHSAGRLTTDQINHSQQAIAPVTCTVGAGGVVLMRHWSCTLHQRHTNPVIAASFTSISPLVI